MSQDSISQLIRDKILKNAQSENIDKLREEAEEGTKKIDSQIHSRSQKEPDVTEDVVGSAFLEGGLLNVTLTKPINSYSKDLDQAIRTIVDNKRNAEVFGSFVYRAQTFPGDVDIHEVVNMCCSPKNTAKRMSLIMQQVVRRIKKTRGYYFSEVKSGNDKRFMLDINEPDYLDRVNDLKKQKLISSDEYKALKLAVTTDDEDQIEIIKEMIRNLHVLRWTENEILQGFKIMRGDKKITLARSMNMKGHIKIDMIAFINGRYIEITNFFIIGYYDKNSDVVHLINTDDFNYEKAIMAQIEKLSSNVFFNPFKLSKRIWGLARHFQNKKLLDILTPFMQSSTARINQIVSDIDTLLLLLKKTKSPPIATITKQIDGFKSRLSYIYDIDIDLETINKMINGLTIKLGLKKQQLIVGLEMIKKLLSDIVKVNATNFLKKNRLLPFNRKLFGVGLFQTAANIYRKVSCGKKARKLLDGENHPACYNYCGPGTRIDLPEVRNFPPYDNVDAICRVHDLDYEKAFNEKDQNTKMKQIREADDRMIASMKKIGKEANISSLGIKLKKGIENLGDFGKKIIKTVVGKDYVGKGTAIDRIEPELKKMVDRMDDDDVRRMIDMLP